MAEWLKWPHLWNVIHVEQSGTGELSVRTKAETEWSDYRVTLPCLLAVSRESNKPRLTSLMGVMKAKKKPLTVWGRTDLEIEDACLGMAGSPTQPGAIFEPEMGRKGITLAGDPEEIAVQLIEKLRTAGLAIETGDVCAPGGKTV